MLKNIDGVKKVLRQPATPAAVPTLADAADFLWTRGARLRRERQQANRINKREASWQREQERTKRHEAERRSRTEKIWQSAQTAKAAELEGQRRRERAQKAKAKLRAEKMAFKLQRHAGGNDELGVPAGEPVGTAFATHRAQSAAALAHLGKAVLVVGAVVIRHSLRYAVMIGVSIIGAVALLAIPVYTPFGGDKLRQAIVYTMPFPAFVVDYRPVSYASYLDEQRLLGEYYRSRYETTIDSPATNELPEVLARETLIAKSILRSLQRRYGVSVSSVEQEAAFEALAADGGGMEVFTEALYNTYGLPKSVFMERVAFYEALRPKLAEDFITDSGVHRGARLRMENAAKLVGKGTQSFEALASAYSEDEHALKGGDIGYVKVAEMAPELAAAVAKLDIGMTSGVLQERGRYYIVKVYDRKQIRDDEEVWLKQISILTSYEFEDYLHDLRDNARVWDWVQR